MNEPGAQVGADEHLAELCRRQTEKSEVAADWLPRFPVGTPEYEQFATMLRAELKKWAAGEPLYEYPEEG